MSVLRFINAKFLYNKKNNSFTLGGVNLYRGKQAAYNAENIKEALLSKDRKLQSKLYSIFPIVNDKGLTIWAKGENGDKHILRRNIDASVAEKLIKDSEDMFATFRAEKELSTTEESDNSKTDDNILDMLH